MRLRTALVGIVVAVVPLAGAAPGSAQKQPAGRTIVVKVSGLPKGTKAKITVKGPKKYVKRVRTSKTKKLRKVRPGKYRVVARKVTAAGVTFAPKVHPRTGKVTAKHGLRVKVRYSARTKPTQPPGDQQQEPPATPFPQALAPRSVILISKTPTGVAGDKASTDPTWSPDGQDIAFSSCAKNLGGTADNSCYLYKAHLVDGTVSRIANTRMTDIQYWGGQPAWSPDGTRLAFTTMAKLVASDTDTNKDVYLVSAAGTNPQRVSQTQTNANMQGDPAIAEGPQWSPDSTRIMFRATATNLAPGAGDIYLKTLASGAVARTGTGERSEGARWSTDGRIAFTAGSDVFDPSTTDWVRTYDVFVADSGGAAVNPITSDHGVLGAPSWSPSGSSIAFSTITALISSDTNDARDIYASGSPPVRISTAAGGGQSVWDASEPVWSPDGQKVAYVATSSQGPSTIIVKNLSTGTVMQLADPTNASYCESYDYDDESGETYCSQMGYYSAWAPVWSPDSTSIAFTATYPALVPGDTNAASDVFVATL